MEAVEGASRVALVTGASRGIGRSIVLRLAREGCDVAVHYRSAEAEAAAVAREALQFGRRARTYGFDLASPAAASHLIEQVVKDFGRLDVLVNNAGVVCDNLLPALSVEEIESVVRTNLLGPILCTRAAAMTMINQRGGRIVNISSSAASKPGRGQSNYAAAKGGLEAFTRAMAVELAPRNILVNAVAPGVTMTEMSERVRSLGEKEIMARLLLKRFAEPDEVADLVCYLASPRNRYMTGEILHLDGGLKMA